MTRALRGCGTHYKHVNGRSKCDEACDDCGDDDVHDDDDEDGDDYGDDDAVSVVMMTVMIVIRTISKCHVHALSCNDSSMRVSLVNVKNVISSLGRWKHETNTC